MIRGVELPPNTFRSTDRQFVMHLDHPGAEDALVAAGEALAARKPSLYVVPSRKDLPWFLQEADQTCPGQVAIAEDGQTAPPLSTATPLALAAGPHIGTFIGCLMSGLSETQYADGRARLQAIDQALQQNGSHDNYCEGITVNALTSFDHPKDSLAHDLDAVRNSEQCVFYVYDGKPRPSGMWVELGAALALNKPCTILTPTRDALPPCVRDERLGLRIVENSDPQALLKAIGPSGRDQAAQRTARARRVASGAGRDLSPRRPPARTP